jgi:glutaredoxin
VRNLPVLELAKLRDSQTRKGNGSDNWKLFTLPNCSSCEQVKQTLAKLQIGFESYDLHDKENKKLFTGYYRQIRQTVKRKDSGELDLPVLLGIDKEGQVSRFAAGLKEIEQFLSDPGPTCLHG